MKKWIAMLLALAMVLGMAGCGGGQDPTEPSTDATNETTTAPTETTVSDGEYTLEKEEGCNQVTFYWDYQGDSSTASFWIWPDGGDGRGYLVYECDYGVKCVVNVPEDVTRLGFIACYGCDNPGGTSWIGGTKDVDSDRFVDITGDDMAVYLKSGDPLIYFSADGGVTLESTKEIKMAAMTSFTTIQYTLAPKVRITSLDQVKVYDGDREVEITGLSSLNNEVVTGVITVGETLDISKVYTVAIDGYGTKEVVPTAVFDCEEFINNYTYDGDDLGPVINGNTTTFKVWAPTASKVVLNLFTAGNGGSAYESVEMTKADRGVWEYTAECGHGTYYTYSVTTSVGTQEATDPYAKAAGVNGNRSMVVDLDTTDPEGWDKSSVVELDSYTDATIWEVHVRDFSNNISSSQYKGKYLAFTERGLTNSAGISVGVDYLLQLGITHIHLLPVYDYATVDETNSDNTFNWGYDPKNYNVPEGSYSTDPYNGEVRINEFKQMVQSLHADGLGVIMDVVYNHTYSLDSSFNKIVPYYYYRFGSDGTPTSASGCGNDTASERYMYRKFMVDSVTYWAKEYKLDGFRFDLMGLHDLETMKQIEEAVHAINPDAIIYGEGWTMGATLDGSAQANQTNISKIPVTNDAAGSVSVFNDAIRDGLKGSVFDSAAKGYISGDYAANEAKVQFGIKGGVGAAAGWQVTGAAVINYMSAHDNNTLWDKLLLSNADNTVEERLAMNRLGAAILNISQGTPFWQAGEEMLRTKDGDENSYMSSDAINNIDWEALTEGSNEHSMMLYYKGLIEMRAAYDIFRGTSDNVTVTFTSLPCGGMAAKYVGTDGDEAIVLINPTNSSDTYTLTGEWKLVANGTQAGSQVISTESGSVTVDACSVMVFVK